MSRAVLVTGGAGYVGSHTCKALAEAGYLPVVLDNLGLGRRDFVRWGPLVCGDVRKAEDVEAAIKEYSCVATIHFAALSSVGDSVIEPNLYYDNNVGGLLGVVQAMRANNCRNIVFSSSAAVYGQPEKVPIVEDQKHSPISPYGRSKSICEHILVDATAAYGISATALRYFNAAGADLDTEIGEYRKVETHLIPRALMSLQGWIDDFQVFGSDFATADGTAVRDYVHVSDLAHAHVIALERNLTRSGFEAFNIGTGRGYSVAEVMAAVSRATGRTMMPPTGARRVGDPAILVADCALARDRLGFKPLSSDLDTIVDTAWRWHRTAHPKRNPCAV